MIPRTFDFDGSYTKLDITKVNDALYKSRLIGWNNEISLGNDLPAYTPDRYMPIKHLVKADPIRTYEKESGVCIMKGTIVATASIYGSAYYASNPDTNRGIDVSGDIRLTTDVFGNPVKANVDDEAFGYGSTMNGGFITIANGGNAAVDKYTQLDVDYGTTDPNGDAVVVDGEYNRPGNIPMGIVSNTVFVDNKNRVYTMQTQLLELNSIKTDYYCLYPYINSATSAFNLGATPETHAVYAALKNDFVFLHADMANLISGKYLVSDLNGNFELQYNASTLTDAKTCQTVGKFNLLDNRFPKEKMDEILTYSKVPGSNEQTAIGVTGSDTGGIPQQLYLFAWKALNAKNGTAPSLGDIQTAIDNGDIGYAKINLHVS